jgi:hypothetical protein
MVHEQALRYVRFQQLCLKCDSIYMIVGKYKAGKSLTIDLMTDLNIEVQDLEEEGHTELIGG